MGEYWKVQDGKTDIEKEKEPEVKKKKNINVYFCVAYSRYFATSTHRVIDKLEKLFKLFKMRVRMYYHRSNNQSKFLNGDLAAKIGQGILSCDMMNR